MSMHTLLPTRLRASAPGLGQASQTEVEQRAAELALSDGREKISDGDMAMAAAELAGGGTVIEALEDGFKLISPWNEAPLQTGHLAITFSPEDSDCIGEQLIEDGLEEADHDIRAAAEYERRYNQ